MTRLSRGAAADAAFLSTSQFVRQAATTPHVANNGSTSVRNGAPHTSRSAKGRSAATQPSSFHKDQESMYEDILELKKTIVRLTEEANVGKAKARRLEEDNKHKEKQLEALLDPSRSEEMRRTIGERKSDAASVIASLKQRVFKLEQSVKDKESQVTALQRDTKATSAHELRVQLETMHQEILRLRKLNQVIQAASARTGFETQAFSAPDPASPTKTNGQAPVQGTKLKAFNNALIRLHAENQDLTKEAQSLKTDLEVALNENQTLKDRLDSRDISKPAKKPDTSAIALAQRLSILERENEALRKKSKERRGDTSDEEAETGNKALEKAISKFRKRREKDPEKIALTGSALDMLDALDIREGELVEEIGQLKAQIKRAKDERNTWKKKINEAQNRLDIESSDHRTEVDQLKDKMADLETKLANREEQLASKARERRVSESSHKSGRRSPDIATPPRTPTPQRPATPDELSNEEERKKDEEERNRRRRRSRERKAEQDAAQVIQGQWRRHRKKQQRHQQDQDILLVQAALDAQQARIQSDMTVAAAAAVVQAAARAHFVRLDLITGRQQHHEPGSRRTEGRSRSGGREEDRRRLGLSDDRGRPDLEDRTGRSGSRARDVDPRSFHGGSPRDSKSRHGTEGGQESTDDDADVCY